MQQPSANNCSLPISVLPDSVSDDDATVEAVFYDHASPADVDSRHGSLPRENRGLLDQWLDLIQKTYASRVDARDSSGQPIPLIKRKFVLGAAVASALSLATGVGANYLSSAVGFWYPIYMSVKALNLHTKVVMKTRRPTLSAVPSAFHSDMAHEEAQAAPLAALQSRPEANPAPLEDLFFVNAENENVAGPKHLMSSKELSRLAKRSTQELKRWLMYWVFFGVLSSFKQLFSWLPFRNSLKVIGLFWLLSPRSRALSSVYLRFIEPLARAFVGESRALAADAAVHTRQTVDEGIKVVTEKVTTGVLKSLEVALPPPEQSAESSRARSSSSPPRLRLAPISPQALEESRETQNRVFSSFGSMFSTLTAPFTASQDFDNHGNQIPDVVGEENNSESKKNIVGGGKSVGGASRGESMNTSKVKENDENVSGLNFKYEKRRQN